MRNARLLLGLPLSILLILTTAAGAVYAGDPHAPAVEARPVGNDSVYIVKPSDTLWDIAARYDVSVEALSRLNPGIDPKRLVVGQKLHLSAAKSAAAPEPSQDTVSTYTVRAGDTLWDIATRHHVFLNDLIAANPGVDPKRLIAGQQLVVAGEATAGEPTPHEVSAIYSVRPDDTLWDIAANYGLSLDDLLSANPRVDPRRLMAGQQLSIPGIAQEVLSAVQSPAGAPTAEAAPVPVIEAPPQSDAPPAAPAEAPAAAPDAAPPPAVEASGAPPEVVAWVQEMLNQINEKRVAGGRAPLAWNNELALAAQRHAEDCATRNRGSHVGSDGAKLRERLDRVGYNAQWSGENWANARSVGRAFAMWWNEPPGANPHVRNIMEGRATEVGIGAARGAWGWYFIADFGTR